VSFIPPMVARGGSVVLDEKPEYSRAVVLVWCASVNVRRRT